MKCLVQPCSFYKLELSLWQQKHVFTWFRKSGHQLVLSSEWGWGYRRFISPDSWNWGRGRWSCRCRWRRARGRQEASGSDTGETPCGPGFSDPADPHPGTDTWSCTRCRTSGRQRGPENRPVRGSSTLSDQTVRLFTEPLNHRFYVRLVTGDKRLNITICFQIIHLSSSCVRTSVLSNVE